MHISRQICQSFPNRMPTLRSCEPHIHHKVWQLILQGLCTRTSYRLNAEDSAHDGLVPVGEFAFLPLAKFLFGESWRSVTTIW